MRIAVGGPYLWFHIFLNIVHTKVLYYLKEIWSELVEFEPSYGQKTTKISILGLKFRLKPKFGLIRALKDEAAPKVLI